MRKFTLRLLRAIWRRIPKPWRLHAEPGFRVPGEYALRGNTEHREKISAYFGDIQIDPDHKIDRDLVILAFTNRCGSNFLGQLLCRSPDIYGFREDLNHDEVVFRSKKHGIQTFQDYLDFCVKLNAKSGAAFGVKASAEQIRLIHQTGIDKCFRSVRVIRLRRRDRIAQAVSLWIARNSGQWSSRMKRREFDTSYDGWALRQELFGIQLSESALDLVLSAMTYPVTEVTYENLLEAPEDTARQLQTSFALGPFVGACERPLERQNSEIKDALVARFRADLRRLWSMREC